MRVAVVSNINCPGFVNENTADHLGWMDKAKREGARLVLFPELSLTGYTFEEFITEAALDLESRECGALFDAASRMGIYVAFGMALKREGKVYISHVLAGPEGLIGHYEKVHLAYPCFNEGSIFSPGEAFRVFDIEGVCVGINICMDGRFPGSSLSLSQMGAEIILHPHGNEVGDLGRDPADWTKKKHLYLGPRALDTCTYSLICNSVGRVQSRSGAILEFSGGAMILGPQGEILARSNLRRKEPHMVVCDLNIERLRTLRKDERTYRSMWRPDVYLKALTTGGV
ncbi:MAG: hypothetical protein JSV89_03160 [Spirochaetaceae bacterium]|nr:MAG: hypothetical protein JSV89_03160 [Spirochaetaceae bacterium]